MKLPISFQYYPLVILLLFLTVLGVSKSVILAILSSVGVAVALSTVSSEEINNNNNNNNNKKDNKKEDHENSENKKELPSSSSDSDVLFQQKRDMLHSMSGRKSPESKEYGGKNLRKDFKKSGDHAFHEEDTKEKELRAKIARELLDTERAYVEKLTALVEACQQPIKSSALIGDDKVHSIFSNIEIIKNFNVVLLKDLERIMSNWSSHSILSGVFLQMADFLKLYTTFINNYTSSMETLASCAKIPGFTELLEKCKSDPRCHGLDLPSLLIMPVQRIPRYILLLTEIHKHTPKNHPDLEKLTKSLAKVKAVADDINEARREAEALTRIYELTTKIDGLDDLESLISPSRHLVLEGKLLERPSDHSKNKKERHYFLFNDMLMSTKLKGKRYQFYWKNPLQSISLVPEANNEFGLSMVSRVVMLTDDSHSWAEAIARAQATQKSVEQTRGGRR